MFFIATLSPAATSHSVPGKIWVTAFANGLTLKAGSVINIYYKDNFLIFGINQGKR